MMAKRVSARPDYKEEIDEFDLSKIVEISRNLYAVDQSVADLCQRAMSDRLPCGYAWTTITKSSEGWKLQDVDSDGKITTKEGQAQTGDVKSDVKRYHTPHMQVILDVLIDNFFNAPHRDKELNEYRDEHELGVELSRQRRTLEGMLYDDLDALNELRIRRRAALVKLTQDPMAGAIEVFLGTLQFEKAAYAIRTFREGSRSLLADLCARFGKTIWAGVVADLSNRDIIIVATYVKTVHTSFRKDLGNKKQFLEVFDFINCEDKDWRQQITMSLGKGRRVVLFLSLCPGNNRADRIEYIGSLSNSRLWVVDEADYGAHQKKQVDAMKQGVQDDDLLLLMTGTNPDIAVRQWADIRKFGTVSCTYGEALEQKSRTKLEMLK